MDMIWTYGLILMDDSWLLMIAEDYWWFLTIDGSSMFWYWKPDVVLAAPNVRQVQLADAEAELRELMKHLTANGSRKVM